MTKNSDTELSNKIDELQQQNSLMHKELHAFTNKSLPETVPNSSSTYVNKLKEITTIIFKPKNIMQTTAKTKSDPANSDLEIK